MIVDQFGHCVKCGINLIIERVIGHEVKKVPTALYDSEEFVLNDTSRMKVTICTICKHKLVPKDYKTIMKSVIAGWKKEVNTLDHWPKDKKDKYMKEYRKKKIKKKFNKNDKDKKDGGKK